MNPQFVTIVTPSEIVIKIEIHIEVEDFTGKLFFCIPYSMIEPVKEKLYSGIQGDKFDLDHRWVGRLKDILMSSSVEVVAEIGKVHLTFGDLMSMKEGDVFTINSRASAEAIRQSGSRASYRKKGAFSWINCKQRPRARNSRN
jgi:flagellar motor switch protein FliM